LTGQRNLIEFASSGLSHSHEDFTHFHLFPSKNMALITPDFYAIKDPLVAKNYGRIKITNEGV